MIEIVHRYTRTVVYTSAAAEDIAAAVIEANLRGANLAGAYLAGANLAGAYLRGANLEGAILAGATLAGATLAGAYLAGATLAGAYLAGAILAGANLEGANLAGANLEGAILRGANLEGAVMDQPVIQIQGSRHFVVAIGREVTVGCIRHSLAHWLANYESIGAENGYTPVQANYESIGAENGYTPVQIAEYGEHLRYIERWLTSQEKKDKEKSS